MPHYSHRITRDAGTGLAERHSLPLQPAKSSCHDRSASDWGTVSCSGKAHAKLCFLFSNRVSKKVSLHPEYQNSSMIERTPQSAQTDKVQLPIVSHMSNWLASALIHEFINSPYQSIYRSLQGQAMARKDCANSSAGELSPSQKRWANLSTYIVYNSIYSTSQ